MNRSLVRVIVLALAILPFLAASLFGQGGASQSKPADPNAAETEGCMKCHSAEAEEGPAVDLSHFAASPHADMACTDCHSSITAAPHTEAMLSEKPSCASCHEDEGTAFSDSIHAHKDLKEGDHPSCVTCHAAGNPHGVVKPATLTRVDKVNLCSSCHRDAHRMDRYGVARDAASSYDSSFHGKALLAFGNSKTAICTDCHTTHHILPSSNPKSSTNQANVAGRCSQPSCHPGATMNFAMSGAGHMHLTVSRNPFLSAVEGFFRFLTIGTLILLFGGVAMDLRRSLTGKPPPPSGRVATGMVSVAFLLLIAAIVMALYDIRGGFYATVASVGLLAFAVLWTLIRKRRGHKDPNEPKYQRLSVSLRIQHALLATSFIVLVLTGMPVRHPNDEILRGFYLALGGMPVMRIVHRVAAVTMMSVWVIHTLELLWKWKKAGFTLASWSMWPTRKDVSDLVQTVRYHLGLAQHEPAFDRFQFREKFDYFAVYWGMPIMVLSGLVLWFPVFFGVHLPRAGIPTAYIAHSDEAVLAFLTIVTWHFYNTQFNPRNFPINPLFITGTLTRSEMERDHPLELARIEAGTAPAEVEVEPAAPEAEPAEPEAASEPQPEPEAEAEPKPDPEADNPPPPADQT